MVKIMERSTSRNYENSKMSKIKLQPKEGMNKI